MAVPHSGADSLRDYGIAAPHGPNMTGEHVATQDVDIRTDMSENERDVFHALLHPDDMYDSNGTYWADMPLMKRVGFVTAVDRKEAKEEASYFWAMFKKDPLEPMRHYFRTCVIPGAGLGLEGYVLFSIGNVRPLLQAAFPSCWKSYDICNKVWTQAVDYLEICGIIVGKWPLATYSIHPN
jgi:hypothetical protein